MPISCRVRTVVKALPQTTFELIAPIHLPQIFRGFGPFPAVTGVKNQTGDWNGVGQTRNPQLSDGSTALETLTAYENPTRFAYRIRDFTGVLRFLVREIRGEWLFSSAPNDSTCVDWKYDFLPRSPLTVLPLLLVRFLWGFYMKQCLQHAKIWVEASG